MSKLDTYRQQILSTFPDLLCSTLRLLTGEGQFNDIVIVDESIVFRFPRTPQAAEMLTAEVELLLRLQGRLPVPVPHPIYLPPVSSADGMGFCGYPMLPGEGVSNTVLAIIDDQVTDLLACQLAGFLRELHALPVAEVAPQHTWSDERRTWDDLYARFRTYLFPFMRPDARNDTTALFAAISDELQRTPVRPVLTHGDFGGSNILYDPQTNTISGVIDFGMAGVGDPAADIASFSCFGEDFLARGYAVYPEMAEMLPRARLYRETFALQQALYALSDGNQEDFEDGMRQYV